MNPRRYAPTHGLGLCALCLAACLLAGCGQPYLTPERLERGLVIVLPGIEGRGLLNERTCEGLNSGGVGWAIEVYDWTSWWRGPLGNQRSISRNHDKAEELADRISRYQMSYPGRPVVLIGQSGGGAIGVWTAEDMAPGGSIDGVIMLGVSLSPDYPLERALKNARRGIVSFYSDRDWVLYATAVVGTMDGEFATSAGRTGFQMPTQGPVGEYRKLYQIGWSPEMSSSGHAGGHLTSGSAGFVAEYVAPLVLRSDWSQKAVSDITRGRSTGKPSTPMGDPWKPLAPPPPDAAGTQ